MVIIKKKYDKNTQLAEEHLSPSYILLTLNNAYMHI